ncbi:hypothetical protein D3C73_1210330 [compost metagenome]
MLAQITEQIRLELIIAATQRRPQKLHSLGQHLRQIQLGLAAAHQSDQHPTTVQRHKLEVQRRVIAAHRVENDIERPQVVQALQITGAHHATLGTERFAVRQPFGRADADPARIAERLAQLNGG